jgi:hypothetical protein
MTINVPGNYDAVNGKEHARSVGESQSADASREIQRGCGQFAAEVRK